MKGRMDGKAALSDVPSFFAGVGFDDELKGDRAPDKWAKDKSSEKSLACVTGFAGGLDLLEPDPDWDPGFTDDHLRLIGNDSAIFQFCLF